MFEVLELQRLLASDAQLTLVPDGPRGELVAQLLAARVPVRPRKG